MADILVEVDTPANQGVKAGDPGTAQATVDDDEFNDQSPVPWGSVGARKGSVIKNGSQHTITDIHIRRTDGKKFDQKCTGGNGFPNPPKFSNNDTEVEFSGGNIPPGKEFWMKVPQAPQPDEKGKGTVYTGYLTPIHRPKTTFPISEPKASPYALRSFDCMLRFEAAAGTIAIEPTPVSFVEQSGSTSATDTRMAGSMFWLSPLHVVGPSTIEGVSETTGGLLTLASGDQLAIVGGFSRGLLAPDTGIGDFDSVIQARLLHCEVASEYQEEGLGSFLSLPPVLFIRSNIVAQTRSFTADANVIGSLSLVATRRMSRLETGRPGALAVVNSKGLRSSFSVDRLVGTLVRTGVSLIHAEQLADAIRKVAGHGATPEISTDDLRRIGDLGRDNPFESGVRDILDLPRPR